MSYSKDEMKQRISVSVEESFRTKIDEMVEETLEESGIDPNQTIDDGDDEGEGEGDDESDRRITESVRIRRAELHRDNQTEILKSVTSMSDIKRAIAKGYDDVTGVSVVTDTGEREEYLYDKGKFFKV